MSEVYIDHPRRRGLSGGLQEQTVVRTPMPTVARKVTFTAEVCPKCPDRLRCHRERLCWRSEQAAIKLERRVA